MAVLPIVARELRVAARRKSTYRFRLAVAFGAVFLGGWVMLVPVFRSPQTIGMAMFTAISVVAFIECFLAGIVASSDCISEEKREGTLGLLFLTDLRGYDIVLGKLAATSLNAFYGLLAVFPIMAIPLLAGGVAGAEFGRVVLAALNILFFSLAVGVFASSLCRDERAGGALTFAVLALFTIFAPVVGGFLTEWKREPDPIFLLLSPGYSAVLAFDAPYQAAGKSNYYYISVAVIHACGWCFLLLASLIVPRHWQEKTEGRTGWRNVLDAVRYGALAMRQRYRRYALSVNPFYWLVSRDRMSAWMTWGLLALVGLIWLWGLLELKSDFLEEPIFFLTGFTLHVVMKLWVAGEAAKRFGQDRRSGALELILSTPLSIPSILYGQLLGLWKQFAGPSLVVLVVDALFLWAGRESGEWVIMCVVGMVTLGVDLVALAWVGMWMGLKSRHANRAAAGAVLRVMVLPWIVWGGCLTFMALASMRFARPGPQWWMEEEAVIIFWGLVSVTIAAGFGLWSRARLRSDFRLVATQRHDPKQRVTVPEISAAARPRASTLPPQPVPR